MRSLVSGLFLLACPLLAATENLPVRSAPIRPGSTSVSSIKAQVPDPAAAMSLVDAAERLGLKVRVLQPSVKVMLEDGTRRAQFEVDGREVLINGLRVFLGSPIFARKGELFVTQIDYDSNLVPLLKPSLLRSRMGRPKRIAIDAGHGGVDQGTENQKLGYKEKTFTLDVALRLKAALEKKGYATVLTRSEDKTVDKPMRSLIANRAVADVFVSIHFNHLPNDQKTRGTEIFTFAPQFQRSTNSWSPLEPDDAEREASPGNSFDGWNTLLANALHRELLSDLKTFDRGKKIAHLGVLRGLKCPGVLVESGFLSNEEEARKIATTAYRQQIAVAIAEGIDAYANQVDALNKR